MGASARACFVFLLYIGILHAVDCVAARPYSRPRAAASAVCPGRGAACGAKPKTKTASHPRKPRPNRTSEGAPRSSRLAPSVPTAARGSASSAARAGQSFPTRSGVATPALAPVSRSLSRLHEPSQKPASGFSSVASTRSFVKHARPSSTASSARHSSHRASSSLQGSRDAVTSLAKSSSTRPASRSAASPAVSRVGSFRSRSAPPSSQSASRSSTLLAISYSAIASTTPPQTSSSQVARSTSFTNIYSTLACAHHSSSRATSSRSAPCIDATPVPAYQSSSIQAASSTSTTDTGSYNVTSSLYVSQSSQATLSDSASTVAYFVSSRYSSGYAASGTSTTTCCTDSYGLSSVTRSSQSSWSQSASSSPPLASAQALSLSVAQPTLLATPTSESGFPLSTSAAQSQTPSATTAPPCPSPTGISPTQAPTGVDWGISTAASSRAGASGGSVPVTETRFFTSAATSDSSPSAASTRTQVGSPGLGVPGLGVPSHPHPAPATTANGGQHRLSRAALGGIVAYAIIGAIGIALLAILSVRWRRRKRPSSVSSSFFPVPRFSGVSAVRTPQDLEAQPEGGGARLGMNTDIQAVLNTLGLAGPAFDGLVRPGPATRASDAGVFVAAPVESCSASLYEEKRESSVPERGHAFSRRSEPPDYVRNNDNYG